MGTMGGGGGSHKQGLISAKDLLIELPEGCKSPYHQDITNSTANSTANINSNNHYYYHCKCLTSVHVVYHKINVSEVYIISCLISKRFLLLLSRESDINCYFFKNEVDLLNTFDTTYS